MARREHQMPTVLRQEGPRPYWYIRIRVRILNQETGEFERKEKWQDLGYCGEITQRQAERLRDDVVRRTNNQVFTLKEQLLFTDFVEIYEAKHMPTLADRGEKYGSLLKNHIRPAFARKRMCDVTTEGVQSFEPEAEGGPVMVDAQRPERRDLGGLHQGHRMGVLVREEPGLAHVPWPEEDKA